LEGVELIGFVVLEVLCSFEGRFVDVDGFGELTGLLEDVLGVLCSFGAGFVAVDGSFGELTSLFDKVEFVGFALDRVLWADGFVDVEGFGEPALTGLFEVELVGFDPLDGALCNFAAVGLEEPALTGLFEVELVGFDPLDGALCTFVAEGVREPTDWFDALLEFVVFVLDGEVTLGGKVDSTEIGVASALGTT